MNHDRDILIIQQYLTGQLPEGEKHAFGQRLMTDEHFARLYKELKVIWDAGKYVTPEISADQKHQAFERLKHSLDRNRKSDIAKRSRMPAWIAVAASVALLIIAGFAVYLTSFGGKTVITAENTTRSVILPDGSDIILAEGAEITFRKSFDRKLRKVTLKGKASFDVEDYTDRPFVVETENTKTTVLGTSFVLHAVPSTGKTLLFVRDGLVRFAPRQSDKFLDVAAGHGAEFDVYASVLRKLPQHNHNAFSWLTQTLEFKEAPMRQVFQELESQYQASIDTTKAKIMDCRLNSSFSLEETNCKEILETLQLIFRFDLERTDSLSWVVKGGNCK